VIPDATPRDEAMDRARVLGREQMFRVGVRMLSETINADEAGQSYSLIADALLQKLLTVVETEMQLNHGQVTQGQCAVIAMGKLGSREMTATSDLDLILVYDHAPAAELSLGSKPISVTQYYARLTQRFVTAITAPTAEGILYEVDLRLRPSGSKGPVAVSLSSFIDYQVNEAWTWEKLALTRARVVAGHPELAQKINAAIQTALQTPRDGDQTRKDVGDMRALMLREQKQVELWDIKRARGGLVEVEFIAQYMQLIHAQKKPELLTTNTHACLSKARELGLLNFAHTQILIEAIELYQRLTQLLRLCLVGAYTPASASINLNEAVSRAAKMPDMRATQALLIETQDAVAQIFTDIIGRP
jgi:[glutamine synthetase] adenylyltransferase / [glutamine synthetase]-adenylyl-L-tyrosine phosphorylase